MVKFRHIAAAIYTDWRPIVGQIYLCCLRRFGTRRACNPKPPAHGPLRIEPFYGFRKEASFDDPKVKNRCRRFADTGFFMPVWPKL